MKNHLVYILCSLTVLLQAQDTIYKRNGEVIAAKIIEINISEVSYKKSVLLDGPLFISNKNEIQKIKYFNGVVDSFAVLIPVLPKRLVLNDQHYALKPPVNFNQIQFTLRRGIYLFQGRQISDRNIMNLVAEKNFTWKNAEIERNIGEYKRSKTLQYVIGFTGAFVGGTALYGSAIGGQSGTTHDVTIAGIVAVASAGVLISSQIISFRYKLSRIKNANKVAKLYNDMLKFNYD